MFPFDRPILPVYAPLENLLNMFHVLIVPRNNVIIQVLTIRATSGRFLQAKIAISLPFRL